MNKLKKWIAIAFIGAFVVSVVVACCLRIAYKRAYRTETYSWTRFVSQDGAFNITLPGSPTAGLEDNKASDGSTFVANRVQSTPVPGVVYAISWWENPAQQTRSNADLFQDTEECDFKAFHGGGSGKDTIVQGYPARQVVIFGPHLAVENLLVRVGPRLYSLHVVDSTGRLDVENIKKFFASLSLRKV